MSTLANGQKNSNAKRPAVYRDSEQRSHDPRWRNRQTLLGPAAGDPQQVMRQQTGGRIHTHSLTLIFSAMMSGSSQMDSTKKTCGGRAAAAAIAAVKGAARRNISGRRVNRRRRRHLVAVLLGEAQDDVPPLCSSVGGIKHLEVGGRRRRRKMSAELSRSFII